MHYRNAGYVATVESQVDHSGSMDPQNTCWAGLKHTSCRQGSLHFTTEDPSIFSLKCESKNEPLTRKTSIEGPTQTLQSGTADFGSD